MTRAESALHDRLSTFHVRGEWFERTAVLAEMKKLARRVQSGDTLSNSLRATETTGRARRVNLRLSSRLVDLIKQAAKQEQRSFNSMFEIIVSEWAVKR